MSERSERGPSGPAAGQERTTSERSERGPSGPAAGQERRPIVLLLHGPNLDLLGEREPAVYGTATLADHVAAARAAATDAGFELEDVQAASEAALVAAVHGARARCAAIVVNPGALTHYGWSLHDALAAFEGVVIELHLSNPNAREAWRHTSVVAPVATATIAGLGGHGYPLAVAAVQRLLGPPAGPTGRRP